jgi:predicted amino acid racemase
MFHNALYGHYELSSIIDIGGKDLYSNITEPTDYKLRITSIHGDSVILPFTHTITV